MCEYDASLENPNAITYPLTYKLAEKGVRKKQGTQNMLGKLGEVVGGVVGITKSPPPLTPYQRKRLFNRIHAIWKNPFHVPIGALVYSLALLVRDSGSIPRICRSFRPCYLTGCLI